MQFDFKSSVAHLWITAVWCALGAVVLSAIAVISCWIRKCRPTSQRKKQKCPNHVRRTNSSNEFDATDLTAANKRQLFSRNRSASSEHSDQSEHSEKSPLVSARIDNLTKIFTNKSILTTNDSTTPGNRDTIDSILARPNIKYQYTALDSGSGIHERNSKERANRDRALHACQKWTQHSNGRYEIIGHLDEIGSRHNKNWFLVSDATVRTDRLMTLLPLPIDCVALEELPPSESPKGILMELLGSLHHPYIYPVLDLGFLHTETKSYACLVMPFNPRGSLKDLIFKSQWNEPWNRKYTKKPTGLPLSQVQRLGRQILEALLFLKERGFPLHGHLHSGNVILQNGVARLSGLENGLLGLSSRINAIMWSRTSAEIENIDVICFGHLLYEMCVGYELNSQKPSIRELEEDLSRYPPVLEILILIFGTPDGIFPTLEELVLCDWFRSIDLRELRGPCVSTIKPSLSKSTLNLLHAVKRRQTASMNGSFSETSSPCTPPSTPRDPIARTLDSFDISSDSESALDEIVITSSSYDSHHYDPLQSPIHYCDNSLQSDDNSSSCCITSGASNSESIKPQLSTPALTPTPISSAAYSNHSNHSNQSIITTTHNDSDNIDILNISPSNNYCTTPIINNNQLTTEMCNLKNSKSRRLEYSLKCLKYGRSNPSQDSAFGSLTDGELSIASSTSFRLNSFQSISSPIDEGVEDIIIATTLPNGTNEISLEFHKPTIPITTSSSNLGQQQNDSAISTPCHDYYSALNLYIPPIDDYINRSQYSLALSPKQQKFANTTTNTSSSICNLQQFDPPKILVNDQSSTTIYTTSPSKKNGSSIEVFSQKYRVCSFEDMSPNRKNNLRHVNKMAFRSLEEEQRIDSAFIPINDRTHSENRVYSVSPSNFISDINITDTIQSSSASEIDRKVKTLAADTPSTTTNNEKYKKLTHSSFRGSDLSRNIMWKDNILYRQTKMAKSNDSLLDIQQNFSHHQHQHHQHHNSCNLTNSLQNNTEDDNHHEMQLILRNRCCKSVNEISNDVDILNTTTNSSYCCSSASSCSYSNSNSSSHHNISDGRRNILYKSVSSTGGGNHEKQSEYLLDVTTVINPKTTASSLSLNLNYATTSYSEQQQQHSMNLCKFKHNNTIHTEDKYSNMKSNDNTIKKQQSFIITSASSNNLPIIVNNDDALSPLPFTPTSIGSTNRRESTNQHMLEGPGQKRIDFLEIDLSPPQQSLSPLPLNQQNVYNIHGGTGDDDGDSSEVDGDDDDDSPLHQDICKIIGGMKDTNNSEEKTPLLLDSVEMSPISPNEPDLSSSM